MTRHPVLPHPFKPLCSFLSYATGDERIEVKPEWASHYPASGQQSDAEKAGKSQTLAQVGRR